MIDGRSKITRKGQVTVPVEIRRALGLRVGDRVAFSCQDGEARLRPAVSYTERTKGAVKADQPALSADELRAIAEEAFADEVVARSMA